MSTHARSQLTDALVQFVAVPFDGDTYRRLLYLLAACPLGFVYFFGTTTGLSTGVGLSVTLIGLPILLATLLGITAAGWLEASLVRLCLGRESPPPAALTGLRRDLGDPDTGYLLALKRFLAGPSTWASLGLVTVKSVFGFVAFAGLVTAATVVGSLLAAPVLYDTGVTYQIPGYAVETLLDALGLSAVGVLAGLVSLHLSNAVADFGGRLTESLLAVGQPEGV